MAAAFSKGHNKIPYKNTKLDSRFCSKVTLFFIFLFEYFTLENKKGDLMAASPLLL